MEKNKISKIFFGGDYLYILFIFFILFPYVSFYDLGTDTQPYALLMAVVIFFRFRLFFTVELLLLLVLLLLSVIVMLM